MSQKNQDSQTDESVDLYVKAPTIYTRSFTGYFRRIRQAAGTVLFLLFFGTVWLNWNGQQAVWWNLPERKFNIFGATFWPQDFVLLSWLLIICAFGLFFITVFAGRVWCGYACPQSVFMWVFSWVAKITEGERHQRMKWDKAPMSWNKFKRKAAKHALWLAISLAFALTFVGYFYPIRALLPDLLTFSVNGWTAFWVGFFTLATYGNAGYLREQVCIYMCPYARFQSVMFDKDTLIISYDVERGEQRGPRKKTADYKAQGMGDCIDCTMCVQVCPTGIDIRDGLQIQCISCAACVDACNAIMHKMNYPQGLISYTTEHNLSGAQTHLLRPRLLGYATALVIMISLLVMAIWYRPLVEVDVLKDRGGLYRENEQGHVANVYTLKIMNKSQQAQTFTISVSGLEGLHYKGRNPIQAEAGEVLTIPVELSIPHEQLKKSANTIQVRVQSAQDPSIQGEAEQNFLGPVTY